MVGYFTKLNCSVGKAKYRPLNIDRSDQKNFSPFQNEICFCCDLYVYLYTYVYRRENEIFIFKIFTNCAEL